VFGVVFGVGVVLGVVPSHPSPPHPKKRKEKGRERFRAEGAIPDTGKPPTRAKDQVAQIAQIAQNAQGDTLIFTDEIAFCF